MTHDLTRSRQFSDLSHLSNSVTYQVNCQSDITPCSIEKGKEKVKLTSDVYSRLPYQLVNSGRLCTS